MHFCEWTLPILINISLYFVLHFTKGGSQWFNWPVTVKITGPRTTAGKTHVWPVHLLYIIMFKIRKSKPNSDSKAQKFSPWLIDSVGSGNGSCKIPPLTGIEQEWHLKRLNTLGGLEIGIQHQIVNTLELSNPPPKKKKKKKKKSLFILVIKTWLKKLVALWKSLVTWKLAQYLSNVWKPNCQVCHFLLFCWYCSFAMCIPFRSRISSTVANRYRKSTSLLKRGVSITSISLPIRLLNIAFQSVPCIHAEWAILDEDVRDASRRLLYYYIFIEKPWQALNIAMVGLY